MQIQSHSLHFLFEVENTSLALSSLIQTKGYLQAKEIGNTGFYSAV